MIIEAGPAHASVMAALHGAAFPREPWDAAAFAALLAQPGVFAFLDPRSGLLLLRVAADESEILTIGVTRRRTGIGRALMRAAIARAKAAGAQTMFLEVAEDNDPARSLYTALGFAPAGKRPAYYAGGRDAIVLSRRLENPEQA